MLQSPATKARWIMIAVILLSLIAPWHDLADEPVSGWFVLASGLLAPLPNWPIERLLIILLAGSLVATMLLGLTANSFARQRQSCRLLLLTLALLFVWILTPDPNHLFGVWLTAACIIAAILLELIVWATARGKQS
jgi:hypothetical protein